MKFNKILLPTTLVTFTTAQSLNEQQETTDEQNQVDASQVLVSSTALSDGLGGSSIPTDIASVGDSGSDSSGGTGGESDPSGGTGGESDPSGGTGGGPNPEDKDKDEPDTGDKDKDEPEPEDKDKDGPKPEDKDKDESKPKDTVGTTPTDEDGTTSSEPEPTSTPLVTDTETTPGILPIIYPSNNETLTKFTTKTEIVTAFTTYCPEPTTIITNEKTIIVSEPTTLTITDCPCTITKTIPIHTLPAVVTSSKGASATSSVAKPTAEVISNGAIDVAPSVMGIVAAALMLL